MSLGGALRTYLLTKTSVTNLVASRIYPQVVPQKKEASDVAYPAIAYTRLGGDRTRSLGGANGQVMSSVQFSCFSYDYDTSEAVAEALRNVLECFQGTFDTTTVQGVFVEPPNDLDIPNQAADGLTIHQVMVSADIWFEEAVPTYV
jgi:hypothetical protein